MSATPDTPSGTANTPHPSDLEEATQTAGRMRHAGCSVGKPWGNREQQQKKRIRAVIERSFCSFMLPGTVGETSALLPWLRLGGPRLVLRPERGLADS